MNPPLTKRQMVRPSQSCRRLECFSEESVHNLANAIICVAADDYRFALENNNRKLAQEVEEFFASDWYAMLTDVDPEVILSRIRSEFPRSRVDQKWVRKSQ